MYAAAAAESGLPTFLQVVFSYTSRDFFRAISSARTGDVNKSCRAAECGLGAASPAKADHRRRLRRLSTLTGPAARPSLLPIIAALSQNMVQGTGIWGRGRDEDCSPPPASIRTCMLMHH